MFQTIPDIPFFDAQTICSYFGGDLEDLLFVILIRLLRSYGETDVKISILDQR